MKSIITTCLVGAASFAQAAKPFNVVFIYTDEHNFRTIESYLPHIDPAQRHPWGDQVPLATPHLNYLSENGVIMTNCYVSSPLSTPSRASLMTGLYPQKTNCIGNDMVLDRSLKTLPQLFQEHGYATGYMGKWHLSGKAKPGFNPTPDYGWEENDYMFNRGHYKSIRDQAGAFEPKIVDKKPFIQPGYDFMTDWLTDKAIDFMDRNKEQPFLCFISIPDPHGPNEVDKKYEDMYANHQFLTPTTAAKKADNLPSWAVPKEKMTQKGMRNYWGMVKCIDDNVGRLIDWLRENDELDNTIIVFTSDHGDMCGEHGRHNKSIPYEGSLKVPFIMYAPQLIEKGHVVNTPVSNIDLFPTLASLCQVEGVPQVDGMDISPLLKGDQIKREYVFSRSGYTKGWLSVATDRYKLIHSVEPNDQPWLIDRQEDPSELVNYYSDPAYRKIQKRLTKELRQYCEQNNEPKYKSEKLYKELNP